MWFQKNIPAFKLQGAFRSGSNYLLTLLERNYHVKIITNNGGWKHGPIPTLYENGVYVEHSTPVLLIIKQLLPWLVSMHNYSKTTPGQKNIQCGNEWPDFLRSVFIIKDGSQDNSPSYFYQNPMDYWNSINLNVQSLNNCEIICYEDLLKDPQKTCSVLQYKYQIKRKEANAEFFIPSNTAKRMGDDERTKRKEYTTKKKFDRDYYLNEDWNTHFTPDQKRFVLSSANDLLLRIIRKRKIS
jgi:hypothetical protein